MRTTSLALLIALATLALAPTARAQEPLTVHVDPQAADAEALARELEQDLGLAVELTAEIDGARLRVVLTESGTIRLELTHDGGAPIAREVEPPSDRGERTVAIALIAANLVRDQSAEILALLRVERARAPSPEPAPPVVIVGAPELPVEAAPEPAPVARPRREEVPVGVDFAPVVGMSSGFLGRDRRWFSLGAVGSLMGELTGMSIGGVVDLVLGDASGAQIVGVVALADRLRGLQIGGALALSLREVEGLQIGAVSLTSGDLRGGQIGAIHIAGGRLDGVQIGAVALAGGPIRGGQIGAVNISGAELSGTQIGAVSVAGGRATGLQIGAVNLSGANVVGSQIGAVNISGAGATGVQIGAVNMAGGDVEGLQIGAVNVSDGRVRGMQIGVVNIAEDADASIGVVNIYPRGRTQLRVGGDSGGLLSASVVHGGRITHSIVSVSTQPFQERAAVLFGVGLGARATFEEGLHLDVDALAHVVVDERTSNGGPSALVEVRAVVGARLIDVLGVYGGLAYQLHVEPEPRTGGLGAPFGVYAFSPTVHAWPALLVGLELF